MRRPESCPRESRAPRSKITKLSGNPYTQPLAMPVAVGWGGAGEAVPGVAVSQLARLAWSRAVGSASAARWWLRRARRTRSGLGGACLEVRDLSGVAPIGQLGGVREVPVHGAGLLVVPGLPLRVAPVLLGVVAGL